MSQCSIYIPGLLGPDIPIEALDKNEWPGIQETPFLAKFLTRGHYAGLTKTDLESRILNGLGISFNSEDDVPMARLRVRQNPQLNIQKKVWCLDPVFIQIDKDDAVLRAHEEIELTESEVRHILEDLNAHFSEDGFKLHFHSVSSWILEAELELTTTSLSNAMQKNISQLQPCGATEKRWRTLLNEIQMLLYSHPVNEARESRGEMPVNSLWLWGGGQSEQYERVIESVYCDQRWINDLALLYEIDTKTIDMLSLSEEIKLPCFLVYVEPLKAIQKNNAFAWIDSLKLFEKKILSELIPLFANEKLEYLTLYSDTISISLQKTDLKKWWKKIKPIREIFIKTRRAYEF